MTRRPLLLAVLLPLLALACASNPPPPAGHPTALPPPLDAGVRSLGNGVVTLALDPGGTRDLDPIALATSIGVSPPPCADFVLAFTWQIQVPERAENLNVTFTGTRQGGTFEVTPPAAHGSASVGCVLLHVTDANATPITVQVRFTVATSRR